MLPISAAVDPTERRPLNETSPRFSAGVWLAVGFSAILNLFQLSLPLYSMQVFDRAIPSNSIPTLLTLSLLMLGLIMCSMLIDVSRSLILSKIAQFANLRLQEKAMSLAVEGGADGVLALRDIDIIRTFISSPLASALLDAPWSVAFIISIFLLHPLLGWLTLSSLVLMLAAGVATYLSTSRSRSQAALTAGINLEALNHARQMLETTKSLGMRPRIIRHLVQARCEGLRHGEIAIDRQAWLDALTRGLRNMVQVAVLALAAYLVMAEGLKTGAIVASTMLFARAIAPAERIGSGFNVILSFYSALRRIAAMQMTLRHPETSFKLPPILGSVEVDNISYSAPGQELPFLRNIKLGLNAGELVALVGPEGAGKSTLARLLAGVITPTVGSVRIDGSNIADFDPEALGDQVGYIPDVADSPSGQISWFISRGQAPDPDLVIRAAKLAGVHLNIQTLPAGYQTVVGDDRHRLSSGERQRIVLARAFYGTPRLLILDNPTAHLDDSGESTIIQSLQEMKKSGSTIIVISRLSRLLHFADQLVMLDGGEIKLVARPDEIYSVLGPRLAASQTT